MDKNYLLKKMEELKAEFDKINEYRNTLRGEMTKAEQEIVRLDGQYIAYNTMLKEIEAMENSEEPKE